MTMPAIKRRVDLPFDTVLERMPEALNANGFGILTEADIQATLKKKIDVDFRRYRIFGACDPTFAHRALQADLDIGVLLPCNVVVYEADDGTSVLSAVNPMEAIGLFAGDEFDEIAKDVGARLEKVLDSFSA